MRSSNSWRRVLAACTSGLVLCGCQLFTGLHSAPPRLGMDEIRAEPEDEVFIRWASNEARQDPHRWDGLPVCPCRLRREPTGFASVGPPWDDPRPLVDAGRYHPNAALEIRAVALGSVLGQQCTYDRRGNLLRVGLSAGTADAYSPVAEGGFRWHMILDVEPYDRALELDRGALGAPHMRVYLKFRPRSGANCISPDRWPADPAGWFRSRDVVAPPRSGQSRRSSDGFVRL